MTRVSSLPSRPVWPAVRRIALAVKDYLPEGRPIPLDVWNRRHLGIVRLVWLHAAVLLLVSILLKDADLMGAISSIAIGALGVLAYQQRGSQRLRGCLASVGLLMASAVMVHLSGGLIEMHFHFFVALAIIAFYQERIVFLVAIVFVLIEHGLVGVLWPMAVYNHHAAWVNPWIWAGIHAIFVAGPAWPTCSAGASTSSRPCTIR